VSDNDSQATATQESAESAKSHDGLVLLAAIILGVAAVLTAWSSYRESLTSDGVIKNYAEQQALISEANDTYAASDREAQLEEQFFLQYAIAKASSNTQVETYLANTMGDKLYEAVTWWEEQPAATQPLSPFVEANPKYAGLHSQELTVQGDALKERADQRRIAAEVADADSDRFGFANVFFAIVLFLAGIATLLARRNVQLGLLILSIVMMVAGLVVLISTPGWSSLN
jgi:hypothetical protein